MHVCVCLAIYCMYYMKYINMSLRFTFLPSFCFVEQTTSFWRGDFVAGTLNVDSRWGSIIGLTCVVMNVLLYGSPLSVMCMVIQTRSVKPLDQQVEAVFCKKSWNDHKWSFKRYIPNISGILEHYKYLKWFVICLTNCVLYFGLVEWELKAMEAVKNLGCFEWGACHPSPSALKVDIFQGNPSYPPQGNPPRNKAQIRP